MKLQDSSQSFYEIRVEGELGDMWANWFGGLSMRTEFNEETHGNITVLYGQISDQPALHSVLNRIRDLNLKLLLVKKYEREEDVPSQDLEI
ncbi:MAG TPA: hypothetical protein VK249_01600 [Anaerolineales bacterium]|nr:hypothetical protein [Anaerolineales bacterium]